MSNLPFTPAAQALSQQDLAELVHRAAAARRDRPPTADAAAHHAPPDEAPGEAERLSFAQQRLWFIEHLHGQTGAYAVPLALAIDGRLDVARLEGALVAVVRRHAALRTAFPSLDGQPVQAVHPEPRLPFSVAEAPAAADHDAVERWLRREVAEPFDLAAGPLIRASLLRSSPMRHVLLVTMHHTIVDGWSLGIFTRELAALYEGRSLPAVTAQYADFSRRQRRWLQGDELQRQAHHWREALTARGEGAALPTDRPRPAVPSFRGRQHRLAVPAEVADRLRRFCRSDVAGSGVTPFMVMLVVYGAALARFGGRRSVVVGCPVANRRWVETEGTIGLFVNTLPIMVETDLRLGLRRALRAAAERVVAAFEHQDLPFEQIVAHLGAERDLDRNPVFQVAFAMQNMALPALDCGDLKLAPLLVDTGTSKFDLTLEVVELDRALTLTFEYATDLFDASTVERIARYVLALLAAGLERPDAPLGDLAPPTAAERADLARWNDTRDAWPEVPADLSRAVARWADRDPDAVAVSADEGSLTRGALDRRANRLAHRLMAGGIGRESVVGLCFVRGLDLVVALLAVLKAGAAFLPLDPALPAERLAFMLRRAGAPLVLTHDRWTGSLPPDATAWRIEAAIEAEDAASWPDHDPGVTVDPGSAAYVIFTSGTTGRPKGVVNTRGGLRNRILWMQGAFDLRPAESVLQKTPVTFDVSVWEFLWPLVAGARLVLARPDAHTDSAYLASVMGAEAISVVHFVPSLLGLFLAETPGAALPALRLVVASGEALTADLRDACLARLPHARLENLYGPTEASIDVTRWSCSDRGAPLVPIGRPIANTRLSVLDECLRPVPLGAVGQLYIGGAGLARCYAGEAGLTAERFIPDPFSTAGERLYATGDRVRLSGDMDLLFLGRLDDQVKLHGIRIEPAEIEARLCGFPGVREAMAGVCDGRIAAAVALDEGAAIDWAALRDFLAAGLPASSVPGSFRRVAALPRTASGKLDRSPAGLLGAERPERGRGAVRSAAEARLLTLWRELLGDAEAGSEDDFFDLGGHSLLAIRLASRIRDVFGLSIPLRRLFQARTVAAQAALIDGADPGDVPSDAVRGPAPAIVPDRARRGEPFPLNPVQQAYWVGRRADVELGGIAAHLYVEIDCPGLCHRALEAALNRLVLRHDMLRCVVSADGEQRILAEVPPYALPYTDLRDAPAAAVEGALAATRDRLSHQILPTDRWPLFDLRAVRRPGDVLRLHVSFDLLVGDALSWITLCSELGRLARDPDADLPPLALSFRDYVLAEERARDGEAHRTAKAYWTARLDALPPAPDLPRRRVGECPRPRAFVRRSGGLSGPRWDGLKRRAASAGLTPSVLLMAAFAEVLGLWASRPDFTLNVTLFNRQPLHPEVDAVVGDFTSLTLLAVDLRHGADFVGRALALQGRLLDDLDHRQYGGIEVLRDIARRSGGSGRAIMPVVFSSILPQFGRGRDASALRDLGDLVFGITQTPQITCDHQVYEEDGALRFNWDVVEDLFPPGLWDDAFASYEALIGHLADDPGAWRAQAPVGVPAWQHRLQDEANTTTSDFPEAGCTLVELVARQAVRRPAAAAVLSPERTLSYAELDRAADAVARWLTREGATAGAPVAVVMQKGWEQAVAALGALKAGAAYVPMDADLPGRRLENLLARSGATLILTQSWIDARVDWPAGMSRLRLDEDAPDIADLQATVVPPRPDDLAYVIYTSGSSGAPKGVAVTHRAIVNTVLDLNGRHGLWPGDRVFGLSSFGFDLSVYDLFGSLAAGAALVLPDAGALRDPAAWLARMREAEVSVWNSVPQLMDLLVDHLEATRQGLPPSLRLAMLSGDWIPVSLPDRVRARCGAPNMRVAGLGGATEASVWSIAHPIEAVDRDWPSIPYGKALANQRVLVLDHRLEPRPVWAPGELFIAGAGLARGYWRDDAETARRFVRHPRTAERLYATGDLGRWRPDGTIEFLGRRDGQVKVNGFRIEPGEVEAALRACPALRDAAVVARGAAGERRSLVAHVVPTTPGAADPDALQAFLRERLPDYMVPATIRVVAALPLTSNGKVDRSALERAAAEPPPVRAAARAPAEGPRARIASLAADILGRPDLADDANILELGASSVDVVRLANALQREFSFRLSFDAFYRRPTVEALAEACSPAAAATPIPRVEASPALILGPQARDAFRATDPGRWEPPPGRARAALASPPPEAERTLAKRRTHRRFGPAPLPGASLARLLSFLTRSAGTGRFLYPSASGLYPLRTFVHVRPGRVAGFEAGLHGLDARGGALVLVGPGLDVPPEVHEPFNNRAAFESAGFSLFLVAHMAAVEPLYGERASALCLLEAGYMGQLLMEQAPACRIGLCPIGSMDFAPIRAAFGLDRGDALLHGFVGGGLLEGDGR